MGSHHQARADKRSCRRNCASESLIRGEEVVSLLPTYKQSPPYLSRTQEEEEECIRLAPLTDKRKKAVRTYEHIFNTSLHSKTCAFY